MIKRYYLLTMLSSLTAFVYGQTDFSKPIVIKPEKVEITTACNRDAVYFSGANGVTKSKPLEDKSTIASRINQEIDFIKNNPKFKGKPAIHCLVNCKGEIGDFYFLQKSGSEQLDLELLTFFRTITNWEVSQLNGETVDTWYMWRLKIKKGEIEIE